MTLQPSTRLGPYEIVGALGAGGMGEVYRAKDTQLDRDVAIKVLPESFALDADRVARFKRRRASFNECRRAHVGLPQGRRHHLACRCGRAQRGSHRRRIPMRFLGLGWTPDGRGLTHADATRTNLWVRPIDGGAARQLTTSDVVLLKGVR